MARDDIPSDIIERADARSAARRARDWGTADRLKAEIEAEGWRVIDAASLYTLERARPPDVVEADVVRYGSSASVPSTLEEEPVGRVTVVLVAADDAAALARSHGALVETAPDETEVVVVANLPAPDVADALRMLAETDPGAPGVMTDVVWTNTRFGAAAAWNAGIRRASAPVVVLLETGAEAGQGLLDAMVEALDDPTVAVCGPVGLVTSDLRRFERAAHDATAVDVIDGVAMAFRRDDYATRGPLDEHFVVPDRLDAWWSLVLRDAPDDGDAAPRRAVQVGHGTLVPAAEPASDRDPATARLAKRNFYRLIKAFGGRRDLLAAGSRERPADAGGDSRDRA